MINPKEDETNEKRPLTINKPPEMIDCPLKADITTLHILDINTIYLNINNNNKIIFLIHLQIKIE